MAKDPAFLFYPGDYLRDTQTLSEKSQVAYDRIMCEHMRNICISKQQLNFFTKRLNQDEIDELMFVLTEKDGSYQIEWVAESIQKRRKYSESRRDNRKGLGKKDMNDISESYDKDMEIENGIVIDYEYIIENYHFLCPKMRKVISLNDTRKGYISARFGEYGMEKIIEVLRLAGESSFLNGVNDKAWKADFEWIMRPNNFLKILEGKYANKVQQKRLAT